MEAITIWRCSKCMRRYDTQEEAAKCEAHHGTPIKVRTGTRCPQGDVDGIPAVIDVLMDNGRVAQYRYYVDLEPSRWTEEDEKERK